eukprot:2551208-Amphidinium_carterae.1
MSVHARLALAALPTSDTVLLIRNLAVLAASLCKEVAPVTTRTRCCFEKFIRVSLALWLRATLLPCSPLDGLSFWSKKQVVPKSYANHLVHPCVENWTKKAACRLKSRLTVTRFGC